MFTLFKSKFYLGIKFDERISVINPSIERPEEMKEGKPRERDLIDPRHGSLNRNFQCK